jgi:hypothetical protein
MRRFLAARRGSFRSFRPGVVVGLVLLAAIAIAVTPTPRASASPSFYKLCIGHLTVTGYKRQEVTLEHASTWDTDVMKEAPKARFTAVIDGSKSDWKSESGFFRGCHATVRYRWPGGSAEFSMTFPYDGEESAGCGFSGDTRSCDGTGDIYYKGTTQELVVDWHLVLP